MRTLKYSILLTFFITLVKSTIAYSQNIEGTYKRNLYCRSCYETLTLQPKGKYEREFDLDQGGPKYSGTYKIIGDTLILTDDNSKINSTSEHIRRKKFIISKATKDIDITEVFYPVGGAKKIIIKTIN